MMLLQEQLKLRLGFCFDSSTKGLIYKAGPDATAAVKKELGL
jgi:hypothetical protein